MKKLAAFTGFAFVALVGLICIVFVFGFVGEAAAVCGAGEETDFTLTSTSSKVVRPLPKGIGRVTSEFNPKRRHPISGRVRPHNGTDFGAPQGSPILAAADGIVAFAGRQGGYGNFVIINHSLPGGKVSTAYAHIKAGGIRVRTGQRVSAGQRIADVGSTGASTGPHLHFEVRVGGAYGRAVNARPWLENNGALSLEDIADSTNTECVLEPESEPTPLPTPSQTQQYRTTVRGAAHDLVRTGIVGLQHWT